MREGRTCRNRPVGREPGAVAQRETRGRHRLDDDLVGEPQVP